MYRPCHEGGEGLEEVEMEVELRKLGILNAEDTLVATKNKNRTVKAMALE